MHTLKTIDSEISQLIDAEKERQLTLLNMIPSENYTSRAVREALGSILGHKYSEGNIGRRYYEGAEQIDRIEQLAISRAAELFRIPADWSVNVQALSGSYANLAAILAVLAPGDTILSMALSDGGHLSHGHQAGGKKIHVVSKLFNVIHYNVDPVTQFFDYDTLEKLAEMHKPKMIITGGTAYPRNIDYARIADIAHRVNALYLADVAHEAGLIAGKTLPSPIGIADIVTMTTHKTLRAARGAMVFAHEEVIAKVNRAVLPGIQGGPFNNNIAAIAVGLKEALSSEFEKYTDQVVSNAQTLAAALMSHGFKLVTDGTDKHLILLDLSAGDIFGRAAAKALASAGIVANMNTIPGEKRTPADPSGLRLGTPMVTTLGLTDVHMGQIALWIKEVLSDPTSETCEKVLKEVTQFTAKNFKSDF
jgi:glycine hydroxymethyltransferase